MIRGARRSGRCRCPARALGLLDMLISNNVTTLADKGYQGAGGTVHTPFKRHRSRPPLSRAQVAVNRAHARIRAVGERAIATLKCWKILTKLRCCPRRATAIVAAILVLQQIETDTCPRGKGSILAIDTVSARPHSQPRARPDADRCVARPV